MSASNRPQPGPYTYLVLNLSRVMHLWLRCCGCTTMYLPHCCTSSALRASSHEPPAVAPGLLTLQPSEPPHLAQWRVVGVAPPPHRSVLAVGRGRFSSLIPCSYGLALRKRRRHGPSLSATTSTAPPIPYEGTCVSGRLAVSRRQRFRVALECSPSPILATVKPLTVCCMLTSACLGIEVLRACILCL